MSICAIFPRDIEPLLNLFTRSSCTLDRLEIYAIHVTSSDYLDVLAHSSCDLLTCRVFVSCRRTASKTHLTTKWHPVQPFNIPGDRALHSNCVTLRTAEHGGVSDQIAYRPGTRRTGALFSPASPQISQEEHGRTGQGRKETYSRTRDERDCFSVRFQRQGFRELPNFDEPFWSWRAARLHHKSPCYLSICVMCYLSQDYFFFDSSTTRNVHKIRIVFRVAASNCFLWNLFWTSPINIVFFGISLPMPVSSGLR